MKNKKEKGFALVMALILLMVMSLLGGSLIVISSTDHQSNNSSDEYQQTFYVAETALLEGEKFIINQMMGPWVVVEMVITEKPVGLDDDESADWDLMTDQMLANQQHPAHFHRKKEETFQVLNGSLDVYLDGKHKFLKEGETCLIQPGVWHSFSYFRSVCIFTDCFFFHYLFCRNPYWSKNI